MPNPLLRSTLAGTCLTLIACAGPGGGPLHDASPDPQASAAADAPAPPAERELVSLPETVELGMIVAALKERSREGYRQTRASGPYLDAVLSHFGEYADMPAVTRLPFGFNLPRLAGNAADFTLTEDGRLVEIDTSGSIWDDPEGDLFRRLRDELEAFAAASDFRSFYDSHRDTYAALIDATTTMIDPHDMRVWLREEFTARPGRVEIFVSPLIGGLHWTTLAKPTQRIWISAPAAGVAETASALDRTRAGRRVFTEMDHGYVNPATAAFEDEIAVAFADTDLWATERAARSYASPQLRFDEYMTWATYLLYARDRLSAADFEELKPELVAFMEDRRGFFAFGDFADALLAVDAASDGTVESTIPAMVEWARRHALAAELARMHEVDQVAAAWPQGEYAELSDEEWNAFKDSVFTAHQRRAEEIFGAWGYIGDDVAGRETSTHFWLLVQHSDHAPGFQREVLEALADEVARGNAKPNHLALLTDRVRLNAGQPQLYGTQVRYVFADARAYPRPLAEPGTVDERRAAIGLEPLIEHLNSMTRLNFRVNRERHLEEGVTEPNLWGAGEIEDAIEDEGH
ncbi:MAG: DUF6624 domain-containing protein [Longimicrobiales bacterium]|nr:DUF6624 domain-containing protein [Longimicrobiales bacterium]